MSLVVSHSFYSSVMGLPSNSELNLLKAIIRGMFWFKRWNKHPVLFCFGEIYFPWRLCSFCHCIFCLLNSSSLPHSSPLPSTEIIKELGLLCEVQKSTTQGNRSQDLRMNAGPGSDPSRELQLVCRNYFKMQMKSSASAGRTVGGNNCSDLCGWGGRRQN